MLQPQTARGGRYLIFGVLGFCLLAILALLLRSTLTSGQTYEEKRAQIRLNRLVALRSDEARKLASYQWVDKAKGVVQIPLERAMALTLVDIKGKGAVATTVKAEPNQTNIVPPYVQTKSAAVTGTTGTTGTSAPVTATPAPPAPGK